MVFPCAQVNAQGAPAPASQICPDGRITGQGKIGSCSGPSGGPPKFGFGGIASCFGRPGLPSRRFFPYSNPQTRFSKLGTCVRGKGMDEHICPFWWSIVGVLRFFKTTGAPCEGRNLLPLAKNRLPYLLGSAGRTFSKLVLILSPSQRRWANNTIQQNFKLLFFQSPAAKKKKISGIYFHFFHI